MQQTYSAARQGALLLAGLLGIYLFCFFASYVIMIRPYWVSGIPFIIFAIAYILSNRVESTELKQHYRWLSGLSCIQGVLYFALISGFWIIVVLIRWFIPAMLGYLMVKILYLVYRKGLC
ncbi:MAG: hypothetical protein GTN69_05800 [Armatimonadetes bacterium]|nr:hypothetical protein [candidate division Zixibacteria bacterium]NIO75390.1 hypothetical protein [Armatimonadota bacterium]